MRANMIAGLLLLALGIVAAITIATVVGNLLRDVQLPQ